MSSDEDEQLAWKFGIGDIVVIDNPSVEGLSGRVIALIYDGIFKYKVSWFVNQEVYETELPEFHLKAPEKPKATTVVIEEDYERLKPSAPQRLPEG